MKADGIALPSPLLKRRHTMNHAHNSLTKSLHPTNTNARNRWFKTDMKCRFAVRAPAAVALILYAAALVAASTISAAPARNKTEATTTVSELMFHRATYEGKVTDDE